MKDINTKELNDKDLEQVYGGQVEESVILAHAKRPWLMPEFRLMTSAKLFWSVV